MYDDIGDPRSYQRPGVPRATRWQDRPQPVTSNALTVELRPAPSTEWRPLWDPEGFKAAREVARLRAAWVDYLARYAAWTHVAVLTPRFDVSFDRILAECEVFARRLAKMTQGPVPWFAAAERGVDQWPHVHALIGGTRDLTQQQLSASWKLGHSHIRIFPGYPRIIAYVAKRVGDSADAPEHNRFKLPREFRCLVGDRSL